MCRVPTTDAAICRGDVGNPGADGMIPPRMERCLKVIPSNRLSPKAMRGAASEPLSKSADIGYKWIMSTQDTAARCARAVMHLGEFAVLFTPSFILCNTNGPGLPSSLLVCQARLLDDPHEAGVCTATRCRTKGQLAF